MYLLRLTLKTWFCSESPYSIDLIIGTQMASTLKPEQCCPLPHPPPPAEKGSVSQAFPG